MNDLLADVLATPTRYWVLALLASALLFVATLGDAGLLVPDQGELLFGEFLAFAATMALAIAPLTAVVRPWIGLALAAVWLVTMTGGILLFTDFAALMIVCVLAGWRSRLGALAAAGVGYAAMAVAILDSVTVIFPGGARADTIGNVSLRLDWRYQGTSELFTFLGGWLFGVLLVVGVAYWLRATVRITQVATDATARSVQAQADSAATAERARLARDLHDVVAHHVSLIAVRAETAPYSEPGIGPEARGVLSEIAGDARLALDELRGVLGILNRADGSSGERAPQPGLGDVPALVERTRTAGTQVRLVGDTDLQVGHTVGYVAYRVVQEALTNARRHAPGAEAQVALGGSDQQLVVTVSNATNGASRGAGHGLAGMRERVEAVGGRLETGEADGRFVVRAALPTGAR